MPDADQLKAYLADRDVPCPGCGYYLRGVAKPVCPECERELQLSVRAERGIREQVMRRLVLALSASLFVAEIPTNYFTVELVVTYPHLFTAPRWNFFQAYLGSVYGILAAVVWAIVFLKAWRRPSNGLLRLAGWAVIAAVAIEVLFVLWNELG